MKLRNDPMASCPVLLEHVDQVLAAPVLGFSILGMLIGFQCLPESEEDVGARQKKRNWKCDAGFSSGALNSSPLWPPEWNGDLTGMMGGKRLREHLAGFFSAQTEERFCALKLTSAAGNLSSVDEMHTFDVWCANDYINTKQRGAVELKCCAETRTFQVILPSAQLIWCGCWVCWCVFVIVKTLITMVCCLHSFLSFNISDVETSSLSVAFGFFCKTRRQIWIKKECCFQVLNWTNHKYWQPTNDHY